MKFADIYDIDLTKEIPLIEDESFNTYNRWKFTTDTFKINGISVLVGRNYAGMRKFITSLDNTMLECEKRWVHVSPEPDNHYHRPIIPVDRTALSSGMIDLLNDLWKDGYANKPLRKIAFHQWMKNNNLFLLIKAMREAMHRCADIADAGMITWLLKRLQLNHFKKDDIYALIYPEAELHPDLQVLLGRALVQVQKHTGVKFIIITNSHFLIDAIDLQTRWDKAVLGFYTVPITYYAVEPPADTDLDPVPFTLKEYTPEQIDNIYAHAGASAIDTLNDIRIDVEDKEDECKSIDTPTRQG